MGKDHRYATLAKRDGDSPSVDTSVDAAGTSARATSDSGRVHIYEYLASW